MRGRKLKMRVAIDKRPLESLHKVRGVGTYTAELIRALGQEGKKVKGLKIDAVDFGKADLTKYDLVHYTYFDPFFLTLPAMKPTKTVVTIHDLIPLIYPNHYPPGIRGKFKFRLQKYLIKGVDGIITPSETSKKDIVRFLGLPAEKIRVIYEAPRRILRKVENSKWKMEIRKKYNLQNQFVLYVGDVNYNKNIIGLISACKIAKTPLVICGKQALDVEELGLGLDVLKGPADWLRFLFNVPHPELAHFGNILGEFRTNKRLTRLGFVPDRDLTLIYNLASVYCQPSFYEGFGLPVLEAMAAGCPVVAAKTQALVEIAGEAALFANPKESKDMAEKITRILKDSKARTRLVKEGEKRVKNFSWIKTADQTLQYYREILSQ